MKTRPDLLYQLLKLYLPVIFHIYFRRFVVVGKNNVPKKGPVIFAVNHQNAFMDAIVVATSSPRNPWFLTRASVFKNPLARFWLNKLQMIPIYRFRDGMAAIRRNDETLDYCSNLLQQNQCILIFPEGNHDNRWMLRPLQKGLARIAFHTFEQSEGRCDVQIVPVGLQYENIFSSHSDLLISFGKPIATSTYYTQFKSDASAATQALMEEVRRGISDLMVDIQPIEQYETRKAALLGRAGRESDVNIRLNGDKTFLASNNNCDNQENSTLKKRSSLWCVASALLFLPHLPAIWLIRSVVNAAVKDPHWTSSIRLAALAFGAPLVYLAELYLLSAYFDGLLWLAPALALLISSGILALRLRDCCHGTKL